MKPYHQKLSMIKVGQLNEATVASNSQESVDFLRKIWDDDISFCESAYALFLNRANKIVSTALISKGGVTGTVVDAKVLYSHALMSGCCSIILAHNHPSGTVKPSFADKQITRKLSDGGKLLDLHLLDHLILGPEDGDGYYSFADNREIIGED